MKAIIIEDEDFAVHRLKMLLQEMEETVEIVAVLNGIRESVKWLSTHTSDLIFLDIHLADGNAFKIFEQVDIRTPIIFTTAYHEYALRAFEQHSIDYLLKPVSREKLQRALAKLKLLNNPTSSAGLSKELSDLVAFMRNQSSPKRFMVKVGNKVKVVEVGEIAYFSFDAKITFLHTLQGQRYSMDLSLKQIDLMLPQQDFFRVNRQYLISRSFIKELQYLSASRVKVSLQKPSQEDIIVARDKLSQFKKWLVA